MDIKVVLIILSVILGCLVSDSMMDLSVNYRRLNLRLKSTTKDPKIYLEQAKKELQKTRHDPKGSSRGYKKSVEDFIRLGTILDGPKCTYDEYEIMEPVTRETEGHRYSSRPTRLLPVNKVVHAVSLLRAETCRPVWPGRFAAIQWAMPSKVIKFAEFSDWNWLRQEGDTNRDFMERLIDYRYKDLDEQIIIDANNHIVRYSQDNTDKCNYLLMIEEYLKEPCRQYRNGVGKLALSQAVYDAQMFEGYAGFVFSEDEQDKSLMPFYLAMAHNELCRVVEEKNFVDEVYQHWWFIQEAEDTDCFKKISAGTSGFKKQLGYSDDE